MMGKWERNISALVWQKTLDLILKSKDCNPGGRGIIYRRLFGLTPSQELALQMGS
jgi:hypothetical protein